jgi:antitoxin ParD1/3/4
LKLYQLLVFLNKTFKMGKNTSILLGNHFENFINSEISSGKYTSVSEVIRTALRLLETEEQKTKQLLHELEKGEKSTMIENFDPKKHLQDLRKKHL